MAAGGWLITDANLDHCDPAFARVVQIGSVNRGLMVACRPETLSGIHGLHQLITGRKQCLRTDDEAERIKTSARLIAPYLTASVEVIASFDSIRADTLDLYFGDHAARTQKAEGRRMSVFESALLKVALDQPDLIAPIFAIARVDHEHPTTVKRIREKVIPPSIIAFAEAVLEMVSDELVFESA